MKQMKRPGIVALALAVIIACVAAIPATLAFIMDQVDPVINTFVPDPNVLTDLFVNVTAKKTVINSGEKSIGPEAFHFQLTNTDTGETKLATSNKKGLAVFNLDFSGMDLGEHHYTLTEINDGRKGVTYSEQVYAISVVVDMVNDKPAAYVYLNGESVTSAVAAFENIYNSGTADEPEMGDDMNLLLYVMMALGCLAALTVLVLRRRVR